MRNAIKLGRYTVSAALLSALLALPCSAQAMSEPYEAPEQYCHDLAEGAYQLALAMGDGLPDGTYERVQSNCLYQAERAHLIADSGVSLNELIAFDHDGDSWLYEGPRSDSDRELDLQDARAYRERCPDAQKEGDCE